VKRILKLISTWLNNICGHGDWRPRISYGGFSLCRPKTKSALINRIIKVQEGDFMMVGRVLSVDEGSKGTTIRGRANFISNQTGSGLREDGYNEYLHNSIWCYLSIGRDIVIPTEEEIKHFLRCEERMDFVKPVFKFNKQFKHRMLWN
jgi:hypothetical protein